MNLNARERKLLIALGVVVVLLLVWFVFLRPSSEPVVLDDLFPPASPSAVASPSAGSGGAVDANGVPLFVIPPDARDPFSSKD